MGDRYCTVLIHRYVGSREHLLHLFDVKGFHLLVVAGASTDTLLWVVIRKLFFHHTCHMAGQLLHYQWNCCCWGLSGSFGGLFGLLLLQLGFQFLQPLVVGLISYLFGYRPLGLFVGFGLRLSFLFSKEFVDLSVETV